jgi:CRP-like cAMP-binding protein
MQEVLYKYVKDKTGMGRDDFMQVFKHFQLKRCKRNEILLQPGDICSFNYFVITGCLRFYTVNKKGNEFTRYFAFENKFGTALTSFIERTPAQEYIQALCKTTLLQISHESFMVLVRDNRDFAQLYKNILEMAYITSQKRIYGLQGQTALERLQWLLNYQPDIFTKISSKVIASYLGITNYSLSRLKPIL